ncbi:Alpha/Beta hydrolase protein [Obelidium mucronatum]|nr:Alpha/Beta hydrolase protein [Obelidium mucronatum]
MDPLWQSKPTSSNTFVIETEPSATLYYELRGDPSSPTKVVLLMGAFATLRHFDQLADHLSKSCNVLTFDHRGIGKSKGDPGKPLVNQTSDLLAKDALSLLQSCASMGGMVAQKLSLLLLRKNQLASLYLAVTARSYGLARFMPSGAGFYRFVLPLAIPTSNPKAMIESILPKAFSKEYLDSVHPDSKAAGKTYRDLWLERWVNEYDEWYSFRDVNAISAQSTVAGMHYLSDAEVAEIVASGVRIKVSVATQDSIMDPKAQDDLATLLKAEKRVENGGHMGTAKDFQNLCDDILEST